ncbi:hypothetical protein IE81DRAFT_332097 [Ceraceosorus guamensis]|uniref:Uncharacterized protein n=1 Tax=Ceraceosorus guamensis TaxID=1522189 RepID=A0A316VQI2_9BASI|nr:hypothetical protein IE81DRAFT_332097 [Ceraceosorus guamensis]PWN39782.1 hypothetical protein IE81DRAFT_332097 [Ceraceosorus guamensis]
MTNQEEDAVLAGDPGGIGGGIGGAGGQGWPCCCMLTRGHCNSHGCLTQIRGTWQGLQGEACKVTLRELYSGRHRLAASDPLAGCAQLIGKEICAHLVGKHICAQLIGKQIFYRARAAQRTKDWGGLKRMQSRSSHNSADCCSITRAREEEEMADNPDEMPPRWTHHQQSLHRKHRQHQQLWPERRPYHPPSPQPQNHPRPKKSLKPRASKKKKNPAAPDSSQMPNKDGWFDRLVT